MGSERDEPMAEPKPLSQKRKLGDDSAFQHEVGVFGMARETMYETVLTSLGHLFNVKLRLDARHFLEAGIDIGQD